MSKELVAALRNYGTHKHDCDCVEGGEIDSGLEEYCTCGFMALLEQAQERAKASPTTELQALRNLEKAVRDAGLPTIIISGPRTHTALTTALAEIETARKAGTASTEGAGELEPVEGDQLPRVGTKVLIHLASRDAWVEHTVEGYYVWGALSHQVKDGETNAHRVFVRVRDADGYLNARLLSEVRPVTQDNGNG